MHVLQLKLITCRGLPSSQRHSLSSQISWKTPSTKPPISTLIYPKIGKPRKAMSWALHVGIQGP